MANRPVLGRVWASTGDNFDPGDSKYRQGWLGEIPTYEVLNFIQNRTDLTLLAMAERGFSEWGGDIAYAQHAIVWDNTVGKVYLAKVANPDKTKAPSTNLAQWDLSAIQVTQQEVDDLHALLDSHINNVNNPHRVSAIQAGTYDRATIQNKLILIQNNLDAHISRTDNPHATTAAQIGAVPITGGSYTGAVTFDQAQTKVNPGTGLQGVEANATRIGIFHDTDMLAIDKTLGRAVYWDGTQNHILLTEAEYLEFRKQYENEYSVPTPDFEIDFLSDINIKHGFGESTFTRPSSETYTNKSGVSVTAAVDEPLFTSKGMRISAIEHGEQMFVTADQNVSGFVERTIAIEFVQTSTADSRPYSTEGPNVEKIAVFAGDNIGIILEQASGENTTVSVGDIVLGEVCKVAYSVNAAGEVRTYLNGVHKSTQTVNLPPIAQHPSMYFNFNYGEVFMRKAQTWSSVLTDKQISTL